MKQKALAALPACPRKETHCSVTTMAKRRKQPNCPSRGGWVKKPGHTDRVEGSPEAFPINDLEIHVATLN